MTTKNKSKNNKTTTTEKNFSKIPGILYISSIMMFIIGAFLPLSSYDNSNLFTLKGFLPDWMSMLGITILIVLGILAILQFVNFFKMTAWPRKVGGILGIIISIVLWLTILGSIAIIAGHKFPMGVGGYMLMVGGALLFIFSIVLLATNRKK